MQNIFQDQLVSMNRFVDDYQYTKDLTQNFSQIPNHFNVSVQQQWVIRFAYPSLLKKNDTNWLTARPYHEAFTILEKATFQKLAELMPTYAFVKAISIGDRTSDMKDFLEIFEREMKIWQAYQASKKSWISHPAFHSDFDITYLKWSSLKDMISYTQEKLEMYSAVLKPSDKKRQMWAMEIEQIKDILRKKLFEYTPGSAEYVQACMDIATLFSASYGEENIESQLLDPVFAAEVLRLAIDFNNIATKHLEKQFSVESSIMKPYTKIKTYVLQNKSLVETKLQESSVPKEEQEKCLRVLNNIIENDPQNLEEFGVYYTCLRTLEIVMKWEQWINIKTELETLFQEHFEDWLDGGWFEKSNGIKEIKENYGIEFTDLQTEAFEMLYEIRWYGYFNLSDENWSAVTMGSKMILSAIAITLPLSFFGPLAFIFLWGTAMTVAGTYIMDKWVENRLDYKEYIKAYGIDYTLNIFGFGLGRAMQSFRYALQAQRANQWLFLSSVQRAFGASVTKGQSLTAMMAEVDDITSIGLRLRYGAMEGGVDYASMAPAEASMRAFFEWRDFWEQLNLALTDPMNFAFLAISPALELSPRSLVQLWSKELREIKNILTEAQQLSDTLKILAREKSLNWEDVVKNPDILLEKLSKKQQQDFLKQFEKLKALGINFNQIIHRSIQWNLLLPIVMRKKLSVNQSDLLETRMTDLDKQASIFAMTNFPLQKQARVIADVQKKLSSFGIETPEDLIRSMDEYMSWLLQNPERKWQKLDGNAFSEMMEILQAQWDIYLFQEALPSEVRDNLPSKVNQSPGIPTRDAKNGFDRGPMNIWRGAWYIAEQTYAKTLTELLILLTSMQASHVGFQELGMGTWTSYIAGTFIWLQALELKRNISSATEDTGNFMHAFSSKKQGSKKKYLNYARTIALAFSMITVFEWWSKAIIAPSQVRNLWESFLSDITGFRNNTVWAIENRTKVFFRDITTKFEQILIDERGGIASSWASGIWPKYRAKNAAIFWWVLNSNMNPRMVWVIKEARDKWILPVGRSISVYLEDSWNTNYTLAVKEIDGEIEATFFALAQKQQEFSQMDIWDAAKSTFIDGKLPSFDEVRPLIEKLRLQYQRKGEIYNKQAAIMKQKIDAINNVFKKMEEVSWWKNPYTPVDFSMPVFSVDISILDKIEKNIDLKESKYNQNISTNFNPIDRWSQRYNSYIEEFGLEKGNAYFWLTISTAVAFDLSVIFLMFPYVRHRWRRSRVELPKRKADLKKWEREFIKRLGLYFNSEVFQKKYPGFPAVSEDYIHFAFKSFMQKHIRDIDPNKTPGDKISIATRDNLLRVSPWDDLRNFNNYIATIEKLQSDPRLYVDFMDEIFPGIKNMNTRALQVINGEDVKISSRTQIIYNIITDTLQKQKDYELLKMYADSELKKRLMDQDSRVRGVKVPELRRQKLFDLKANTKLDKITLNALYSSYIGDLRHTRITQKKSLDLETALEKLEKRIIHNPEESLRIMEIKETWLRIATKIIGIELDDFIKQWLSLDDWLMLSSIERIKWKAVKREEFHNNMQARISEVSQRFTSLNLWTDISLKYEVKPTTKEKLWEGNFVIVVKKSYGTGQKIILRDNFIETPEDVIKRISEYTILIQAIRQLDTYEKSLKNDFWWAIRSATIIDVLWKKWDTSLQKRWELTKRIELMSLIINKRSREGVPLSQTEYDSINSLSIPFDLPPVLLSRSQLIIDTLRKESRKFSPEIAELDIKFQPYTWKFLVSHPEQVNNFVEIRVDTVNNYNDFFIELEKALHYLVDPEVRSQYFSREISKELQDITGLVNNLEATFKPWKWRAGYFSVRYTAEIWSKVKTRTFWRIEIQDPTDQAAIRSVIKRWLWEENNPLYIKISQSANELIKTQKDFHGRQLEIRFQEWKYHLLEKKGEIFENIASIKREYSFSSRDIVEEFLNKIKKD